MTDTLPAFDPHNPEYFEAGLPYDLLAELRQQGPVAKTPLGYYLTRRQEADEDPADLHADYAVPIPCEVIAHITRR